MNEIKRESHAPSIIAAAIISAPCFYWALEYLFTGRWIMFYLVASVSGHLAGLLYFIFMMRIQGPITDWLKEQKAGNSQKGTQSE